MELGVSGAIPPPTLAGFIGLLLTGVLSDISVMACGRESAGVGGQPDILDAQSCREVKH